MHPPLEVGNALTKILVCNCDHVIYLRFLVFTIGLLESHPAMYSGTQLMSTTCHPALR